MGHYNLKNNLILGFSTTDQDSTISKWDSLIFQCLTTLYLLRNYRVNPYISAYDYLYPPYDLKKFTMEPPVTCMLVYYKNRNHMPWGHHGNPGCYIDPSLEYCRCMQFYMPGTEMLRITDTLQYTQRHLISQRQQLRIIYNNSLKKF